VTQALPPGSSFFKAAPRRVAGMDVPIPYNRALETAATPQLEDILKTIQEVMGA
jgi:pyruvate/2-oxoglutarate/acetoin dehydrogenase E1 component